jgi:hypothetical protein
VDVWVLLFICGADGTPMGLKDIELDWLFPLTHLFAQLTQRLLIGILFFSSHIVFV